MTRDIPIVTQAHLNESGTTMCYLIKITGNDGLSFGVTSLDIDVDYDDGYGEMTYSAPIGLNQSAITTSESLAVDNSEAVVLLADTGPVTATSIEAGALDYARFIVYRVNYKDLTPDSHYIAYSGTTGAVKRQDGIAGVIELRGLPQGLKQTYHELYSITCRARFGSQPGDPGILFPCGFDASGLWDTGTVDTVGAETDRQFNAQIAPSATGPNGALPFVPGLLEWLTGDNAPDTSEIEAVNGVTIDLRFPTYYPIQAGDTYTARPDCNKHFQADCIDLYDNYLNFRGEPYIPLPDSPGATVKIDLGVYSNTGTETPNRPY